MTHRMTIDLDDLRAMPTVDAELLHERLGDLLSSRRRASAVPPVPTEKPAVLYVGKNRGITDELTDDELRTLLLDNTRLGYEAHLEVIDAISGAIPAINLKVVDFDAYRKKVEKGLTPNVVAASRVLASDRNAPPVVFPGYEVAVNGSGVKVGYRYAAGKFGFRLIDAPGHDTLLGAISPEALTFGSVGEARDFVILSTARDERLIADRGTQLETVEAIQQVNPEVQIAPLMYGADLGVGAANIPKGSKPKSIHNGTSVRAIDLANEGAPVPKAGVGPGIHGYIVATPDNKTAPARLMVVPDAPAR